MDMRMLLLVAGLLGAATVGFVIMRSQPQMTQWRKDSPVEFWGTFAFWLALLALVVFGIDFLRDGA